MFRARVINFRGDIFYKPVDEMVAGDIFVSTENEYKILLVLDDTLYRGVVLNSGNYITQVGGLVPVKFIRELEEHYKVPFLLWERE